MNTHYYYHDKRSSKRLFFILPAFVLLLLSACGEGLDNQRGQLVSETELAIFPGSIVSAIMDGYSSSGLLGLSARYDVATHKIVYKTPDANGDLIEASGLVAVPVKDHGAKSPVISLQHGTLFLDMAPSSLKGAAASTPEVSYADIAVMFASQGYIVAAADFIGYGDTVGTLHPFVHADTLASTTIDMLRATRKMAARNALVLNGQLFLSGYSEGGYATLAAQRSLELDFPVAIPITASAPAAGPYDMNTTALGIATSSSLPVPAYVGFVMKSYDTVYGLNQIDHFFQAPYVDAVNSSFDGTKSRSEIDGLLTSVTEDLFNASFLSGFVSGNETAFNVALADNDIYDWTPSTKTRFFHGPDDVTVPYINTVITVAAMQNNGASDVGSVDCYLGGFPTTHSNCFFAYFSYANSLFTPLATDL